MPPMVADRVEGKLSAPVDPPAVVVLAVDPPYARTSMLSRDAVREQRATYHRSRTTVVVERTMTCPEEPRT